MMVEAKRCCNGTVEAVTIDVCLGRDAVLVLGSEPSAYLLNIDPR